MLIDSSSMVDSKLYTTSGLKSRTEALSIQKDCGKITPAVPFPGKPITIADCSEHRQLEDTMKKRDINLEDIWPRLIEIAQTRLVVRALVDDGPNHAVTVVLYITHTHATGAKTVGSLIYTCDPADPDTQFRIQLGSKGSEAQQWTELVQAYEDSWLKKPAWCTPRQAAVVLQEWETDKHELCHDSNLLMQAYREIKLKLMHELKQCRGRKQEWQEWLETCLARLSSFIFDCNSHLARSGDLVKLKLP
jgi:hypothetical protein